jgi:hypothetical protein
VALFGKTDAVGSAPKFKVDGGSANVANAMYENVTSGSFKSGQVIGVYAVDTTEMAVQNAAGGGRKAAHAGWVAVRTGTGPLTGLAANAGGTGYGNLAVGGISNGTVNAQFTVLTTNTTGGVTALRLDTPGYGFINAGAVGLTQPANGIYATTIVAGGTGYANSDTLTFSNGVVNASATLTTNTTGGITAVTMVSGGRGFSNTLNTVRTFANSSGGASAGSTANITPTIATGSSLTVAATVGGRAGRVSYETLVAMGSITGDSDDALFPDS